LSRGEHIGITMGDPGGIGPEIALRAVEALGARVRSGQLALTIIGTTAVMAECARNLGCAIEITADASAPWPRVAVAQASEQTAPVPIGEVAAESGRLAYEAVAHAVRLAMAGRIDAIATAPISKEALNLAGYRYAGHTDLLAALTASRDSCMMLAHGDLRVTHVSTHVAVADVPKLVTRERVARVIDLTLEALTDLGIARPRIAVAALNPHAGEGGIFGDEDQRVNQPVVQDFRARGFDVVGPVPGDTVFVKAAAGQFDAVVAMFHDQGHIPVKLLGFRIDRDSQAWTALSGVNVTLGLPIIRTSVDHGTAFDIAGRGTATAQSMIEAIDFAALLARHRRRRSAVPE
jgi:4-phospho-D-threonate 3-dehydrogenase / 4-phospho-D-erythronate 3-dehydrogenase